MRCVIAAALAAAALIASSAVSRAHEGHDHGPEPKLSPTDASPRGQAASDKFEVVAVAQGEQLVVYLDRFASNEPVRNAKVEVETPDGPVAAETSDDTYRIKAAWLGKPGHYDLIVTVTAGDDTDVLPLTIDVPDRNAVATGVTTGWMARIASWLQPATGIAAGIGFLLGVGTMSFRRRVTSAAILFAATIGLASGAGAHEGHSHDDAPMQKLSDRAARAGDGSVFVPKPIQRIFGLRTAAAEIASHRRSIELPGRIIADPTASGFVQTAIGGRLSAPPGGFPRLGGAVRQGDVLAYATPPIQAIDVSDMRQRQGEIDQQMSIIERRLARYERLAPTGAIAQVQLEETKLELEGLKDRRLALDKARREPEALIAPVNGVIAEGVPIGGQIAQPNAVVFQIVDPARLWVEALSFATLPQPRDAIATTANGRTLPLAFRGSGHAERNQSIPVQFQIEGETKDLRAGLFVTVFFKTDEEKKGIAVSRGSVVRASNGQEIVYVHTAPEQFEARAVRVEPLDGERVLVAAGLDPGMRIVVQGAELLDHVR
jgi:cobalt-zinc-cadmium efflux system membrane fusion protein